MNYLLRAEAVNLGHFVYDTNKIQPTRGGSFLLLDSVQQLAGKTIEGVKLEKITTGASIGLYRFTADNGVKPEDVADEALKVLNTATGDHATFAVAYVKDTGNFKVDLLKLQTKVRWQQYQQPTLILPKTIPPTKEECLPECGKMLPFRQMKQPNDEQISQKDGCRNMPSTRPLAPHPTSCGKIFMW